MNLTGTHEQRIESMCRTARDTEISPVQAIICAMEASFSSSVLDALERNPALSLMTLETPLLATLIEQAKKTNKDRLDRIFKEYLGEDFMAKFEENMR